MGTKPMQDDFDLNSVILERVDKRLELLSKIIIGNGEIGMAEDVRTLKAKVKALEQRRSVGDGKMIAKLTGIMIVLGGMIEGLKYIFGG